MLRIEAPRIGVQQNSCSKNISRNSKRKRMCQKRNLFSNNDAGLDPTTLLESRLRHRCFPVNFAKFMIKHFHRNPQMAVLYMTFLVFLCFAGDC